MGPFSKKSQTFFFFFGGTEKSFSTEKEKGKERKRERKKEWKTLFIIPEINAQSCVSNNPDHKIQIERELSSRLAPFPQNSTYFKTRKRCKTLLLASSKWIVAASIDRWMEARRWLKSHQYTNGERERATWDVIVRVYRNPINGGGGKQKGGTHDPPVIPTFTGSFSTEKN